MQKALPILVTSVAIGISQIIKLHKSGLANAISDITKYISIHGHTCNRYQEVHIINILHQSSKQLLVINMGEVNQEETYQK